ncbi:MAG TPA: DUF1365 family protein [Enhygromyxa sp.]|nr:DUF1365 family protein [Enhygromyxa sp.]
MAELDLTNPSHLAALLDAALPDFEDETPERVEPHVEALRKSDHPVFDHVGVGERVDPHEPVEPEPEPDQQQQQQEQLELEPEPEQPQPWEQQQQQEQLPLDLGGEGQSLEIPQTTAEAAGPPIYARRGWTEIDRQRSKGQHEIYHLAAKHQRGEPIRSEFTGKCQAVRVRLPRQKPPADAFIGTWVGTVEAKDHLVFSVEEVEQMYERVFNRERSLQRVDLITGARFRGRRFSPVSIYLGYGSATGKPDFYFLEGGSASGRPQAMYCARHLDDVINRKSGFRFTPFACADNWYEGGLALSQNKHEPACVYLSASQSHDGEHQYLRLTVTYDRDLEMRRVIHPFELQVEAALRVLAIAEQAGCQLDRGQGRVLEHTLGPLVRALMPWDERPFGHPTTAERARYCGCPK